MTIRWVRRESGLLVPGDDPPLTHRDRWDRGLRRREVRTTQIQVWISALLLLLGIPASVLAFLAFREQQQINRSQLAINQAQQEQSERRYAASVTYFDEIGNNLTQTITVANRSSIPVRRATLYSEYPFAADARKGVDYLILRLGAVPPCTVLTVTLGPKPLEEQMPRDGASLYWITDVMTFEDPFGEWAYSNRSGLVRNDGTVTTLEAPLLHLFMPSLVNDVYLWVAGQPDLEPVDYLAARVATSTVSDCGE